MIEIKNKSLCTGCASCESVCPKSAISMEKDGEGFLYPKVNGAVCVSCSLCDRACPLQNGFPSAENPKVYACRNNDKSVVLSSSSGGVFTLLAKETIEKGGAVFGAGFDADLEVVHKKAETLEEALEFQGSKYVMSRQNGVFKEVKAILEDGRRVLFSGTPCQTAGLRSFLKEDYQNLLTVDFVCMGAPSPDVWREYKSEKEREHHSKLVFAKFRDKAQGWRDYSMRLRFKNGDEELIPKEKDSYLRGFNRLLFLRESCHDCRFKSLNSGSDITLGDYWGIEKLAPEFFDKDGVSMVIVKSKKGEEAFSEISGETQSLETSLDNAKETHPSMIKSIPPSKNREKFYREFKKQPFSKLVKKLTHDGPIVALKKLAVKALRSAGHR